CHKNNELQNNKLQPFYQMTKDGFMYLVMGFTGKKAAIIKEAYINAFNLMAEKLTKQNENSINFNPNLYKDFVDLKEHVNFRVLIDVVAGRASGLQFVPDDAFVCNKEKFMH
ncbi:Rha family transcriptional regulator, partial [Vibrio parahaemolyticus]